MPPDLDIKQGSILNINCVECLLIWILNVLNAVYPILVPCEIEKHNEEHLS